MTHVFWRRPRTIVAVRWAVGVATPIGAAAWAFFAASGDRGPSASVFVVCAAAVGVVNAVALRRMREATVAPSPALASAAAFVAGFVAWPAIACVEIGAMILASIAGLSPLASDPFDPPSPIGIAVSVTAILLGGAAVVADRVARELGADTPGRPYWRVVGTAAFGAACVFATVWTYRPSADHELAIYVCLVFAPLSFAALLWRLFVVAKRRRTATAGAVRPPGVRTTFSEALPGLYAACAVWCVASGADPATTVVAAPAGALAITGALLNGALRRRRDRPDPRLIAWGEIFVGVAGGALAATPLWIQASYAATPQWAAAASDAAPETTTFVAGFCALASLPIVFVTAAGTSLWLARGGRDRDRSPAYGRNAVVARWLTVYATAIYVASRADDGIGPVAFALAVSSLFVVLGGVAHALGVRAADASSTADHGALRG